MLTIKLLRALLEDSEKQARLREGIELLRLPMMKMTKVIKMKMRKRSKMRAKGRFRSLSMKEMRLRFIKRAMNFQERILT